MPNRKKNITEAKGTILLVTATKAEAVYFSQMRKDCRYMNLTVVNAGAKSLKDLIDKAAHLRHGGRYQTVWALFGFDDVSTNVDEVNEFKSDYALRKKVNLCWFNPCFEIWFALHLNSNMGYESDPEKVRDVVRKSLPGFQMSDEYLLTKGLNLHLMLFPRHAFADLAARKMNENEKYNLGLEVTSMPSFDDDITEICGKADMSHIQKVFK